MALSSSPSSSAPRPPPPDEHEQLWNLLVLQSEAVQTRQREFHQQLELFILTTGEHPLTGATGVRAAHEAGELPLRDRTTPAHVAPLPLVSDLVAQLARDLCAPGGAVRDAAAMAQLAQRIADAPLSLDDKAQVAFVLDLSFAASPALLSQFEKDGGYGVLTLWVQHACAVGDDAHKALTRLLLQFLDRHRPALTYSRKTVLSKLRALLPTAVGRHNKNHIKETIDKYREP